MKHLIVLSLLFYFKCAGFKLENLEYSKGLNSSGYEDDPILDPLIASAPTLVASVSLSLRIPTLVGFFSSVDSVSETILS